MEGLRFVRIPLFLTGLSAIFASERYLSSYEWHKYALAAALFLTFLPVLITWLLISRARAANLLAEMKSWQYVIGWKLIMLLGIALYFLYRWRLGSTPMPDSTGMKALLTAWLSALIVGSFVGMGVEFSHNNNGEGENAEPERLRYSAKIWAGIGLLFAGLAAFNYGIAKKDKVFDLSYFKSTRPGESTLKIIDTLSAPVKLGLFFAKDSEVLPFVREYVDALAKRNPNLQVEYYDKDFYPLQAEEFRVSRNGQIVLSKDTKKQRIDLGEKLETARKKLKTLDSQFQKALLHLTTEQGNIYFTASHGEMGWGVDRHAPLRSIRNLEAVLRSQNLNPRSLPNTFSAIPENAAAVAIVGPVTGFGKEEVDTLREYLDKGGKLLIGLDIESSGEADKQPLAEQTDLLNLLGELGIQFKKDPLANDREYVRSTRQKFDHLFLYTNVFGSHESVSTLTRNDEKLNVLALQAGYLVLEPSKNSWQTASTIMTLKSTFADKNRNLEYDPDEVRSSYVLAASAEKVLADNKKSRVIVLSDASMLSDPPLFYNGNQWMALDSFRWLTDRMDTAGAIESEEDVKIQHSKGSEIFVFYGSVLGMPILILILGFFANRRRRGQA